MILLIQPPNKELIKTNLPEYIEGERGTYPPIGLMNLNSFLIKNNIKSRILDCIVETVNRKTIKDIIKKNNINLVGIQANSFNLLDTLLIAELIKKIDGNIIVVLGGRHPTHYPTETINLPNIDYLVLGDGEVPLLNLIKNLKKKKIEKIKKIKGLVFKNKDEIINNGIYINKNLDKLPFPLIKSYNNYNYILQKRKKFTTLITSIGCPYNCSFCDENSAKYRERSAKNIVAEIEYYIKKEIRDFFIYDSNFTINKKRTIDFCKLIIDKNIKISYAIRSRVDLIDKELLEYLKKSGCNRIQLGIESLDQKTLNFLNKNINVKEIYSKINLIKQYKIEILANFMIGAPNENKKDIKDMVKKIKRLNIDYAHFSIITPYPKTKLYKFGLKNKFYNNFWKRFAESPNKRFSPKLINNKISEIELRKLLNKSYKEFYFNLKYISQQVIKTNIFSNIIQKLRIASKIQYIKLVNRWE